MKIVKFSFILIAAVAAIIGLSTASYAFHSGGVAQCMGCHNIHDGKSTTALLAGSDISSTCMTCHSGDAGSYRVVSQDVAGTNDTVVPRQMTPGGDFGWLLKTFTWSPRPNSSSTEAGERHGHNIVAADFAGFVADATNTAAPGGGAGAMSASLLGCNSCHDNHGKLRRLSDGTTATTGAPIIGSGSYTDSTAPASGQAVGMYRLLRGPGSTAGAGGKSFTAAFNAVVASSYNRAEGSILGGTTSPTAIAYGKDVSAWCGTCHADMHRVTSSKMTHPTEQGLSPTTAGNYNTYLGSGKTGVSGYDPIVPFSNHNVTDLAALKTAAAANIAGAGAQAGTGTNVMCLSCHRAHASGFAHMTRWNNAYELIAVDNVWPGTDSTSSIATAAKYAMGRTSAMTARSYNDRPSTNYATYQRSLCNKCHAKD